MRLIDADKLPEVNTIERIEGEREVFVNSWIPAAAIWKAPTVEAIPIEWFKKEIGWLSDKGVYGAEVYQWVLNRWYEDKEKWEKENE